MTVDILKEKAKAPSRFSQTSDQDTTQLSEQARKVIDMLRSAERPLIWLGQGIRLAGAVDLIETLLDKVKAPALVTWNGLDMLDSRHPQNFGSAGVYGQRCANFVLQNCDFLLTIGTRLAIPQIGYELSEFARGAKIVINDIDPMEAKKFPERDMTCVVADAGAFIRQILAELGKESLEFPKEWMDRCQAWRKDYPRIGPEHADKDGFINSYPFMEKLSAHLKSDQVIVTDMGTALLSGHQNLLLKKGQRLMTSTGLGEMGYGLPGAIGASFALNRGEVLCLNCDGGMMMNLQELQTVVHHKLPIKIFIFNNDGYLMIKHTQKALFKGSYACVDKKTGVSCPDYSAIAKAFGIPAYQIRTWEDFSEIIPKVQEAKEAVICEVFMHPEQLFAPKLSLSVRSDGVLVSPPLEDLSPLLPREELRKNMLHGLHPKSEGLGVS
jgi:acetolactate synthase-1/2/3 large subunit